MCNSELSPEWAGQPARHVLDESEGGHCRRTIFGLAFGCQKVISLSIFGM
jgi:hypothetical protein